MICSNLVVDSFKILCVLVAAIMVGYWIYKYKKDDDFTLIEIKHLNEIEKVILPEVSICFWNPFPSYELSKHLRIFTNKTLHENYPNYLKGDYFNEAYHNISYYDVTPNIFDHFQFLQIYWRLNKTDNSKNCSSVDNCPYFTFKNSYNGMKHSQFLKCFGIEVNENYTKDIEAFKIDFDKHLSRALTQKAKMKERQYTFVVFNYPNQIVRNFGGATVVWRGKEYNDRTEIFHITSATIFQKRNKKRYPCEIDWMNYDSRLVNHHIRQVGCRAPYQKQPTDVSVCRTQNDIKNALFDGWNFNGRYLSGPCQEMPKIGHKHTFVLTSNGKRNRAKTYYMYVSYPDKMTIISQTQAVDFHSLIGNIGGYIGLFLGYALIQLPEFLVQIYKLIENIEFMNIRNASKNIKEQSGAKRIREMKVDDKRTKSNDVIESKIRTKRQKEEHNSDKNDVDVNVEVITPFITQIKEKFECIDKKFDMIQERLDLQLTEFQANRKTFRRLIE